MQNSADAGLQRELDVEVLDHVKNVERLIERAERAERLEERESSARTSPAAQRVLETAMDRRSFMRGSATMLGSAAIAGSLSMLMARQARAQGIPSATSVPCPYGAPVPTLDEVTGLPLIGLPPGFRYWSHGWTGDPLSAELSNIRTPPLHDGMAVLKQAAGLAILCRNHEAAAGPAYVDGPLRYSPGAAGGNTNLIFDTRNRKWITAFPTLSGTLRNCAGGLTPHNTWLSCEESLDVTAGLQHGWCYEVPAVGVSDAQPIRGMGRRSHEACASDPNSGIVYLTEDATPGGIYRFHPANRRNYQRGGWLEMLKIKGMPNANLRGPNPLGGGGAPYPVPVGVPLEVEWVPIDDPENLTHPSNVSQGLALGGANFRRPEGIWYGHGSFYFVSTDGGSAAQGQVFELCIHDGFETLTLLYDSPSPDALDNPDNITVTPRGALMFCEDNSGDPAHLLDGFSTERLVVLTREGQVFTFANNLLNFSASGLGQYMRPDNPVVFNSNFRAQEWAGASFDRTSKWLFANIQTPGITFAITGPWQYGPV